MTDLTAYISSRVRDGVYDYDQIIDLTRAELDVAPHEVIHVVKLARVHLSSKPIPFTAVVALPGSATFGLTRQLGTLFDFEGATVQIVESVEAANAWIDQMRVERREGRPAAGENR